jgi:hypothetical protein
MRRTHWMGVAAGIGALASVVLVAPVASAKPAPYRPGPVVVERVQPQAAHNNRNAQPRRPASHHPASHHPVPRHPAPRHPAPRHPAPHHPARHHPYPANGTSSVSIHLPSRAHRGEPARVTAKATINRQSVRGALVALYVSDGGQWKKVSTARTDNQGVVNFSFSPDRSLRLRVVVAGNGDVGPSQSPIAQIHVA